MNLRTYLHTKKENGEKVLACFLTAGFPVRNATVPLTRAIARSGADLIELGVPFSDPLADGPVIQHSSMRALQKGVTLPWILETVRELSAELSVPILLMGYLNPILAYGTQRFLHTAKECGVAALIIPDLPIDENMRLWQQAEKIGVPLVPFVSPTTKRERYASIVRRAKAFIYAVSITGVTGTRDNLPENIEKYLEELARDLHAPTLIGFGISNSEAAARMARFADGIIIGSALLNQIDENDNIENNCQRVEQFVREIKKAIT